MGVKHCWLILNLSVSGQHDENSCCPKLGHRKLCLLIKANQDVPKTTEKYEELNVIQPQDGMMIENPTVTYGNT